VSATLERRTAARRDRRAPPSPAAQLIAVARLNKIYRTLEGADIEALRT
jgi:hypothetical protein